MCFGKGSWLGRGGEGCAGVEIPVRMFWNASSTLLASKADVSMNERLLSPAPCQPLVSDPVKRCRQYELANCLASSVGTALKCLKSLLFPTNMITIFASA